MATNEETTMRRDLLACLADDLQGREHFWSPNTEENAECHDIGTPRVTDEQVVIPIGDYRVTITVSVARQEQPNGND